jgi:hypothetical protein
MLQEEKGCSPYYCWFADGSTPNPPFSYLPSRKQAGKLSVIIGGDGSLE